MASTPPAEKLSNYKQRCIPCDFDPSAPVWQQQQDEGEKPWSAFVIYRDAGKDRVASGINGRAKSVLEMWGRRWRWRERVMAYDRHMDAIEIAAAAKERAVMAKRHAGLANGALGVLQQPIAELIRRIEQKQLDLESMTQRELLSLVRSSASAIKDLVGVERLSRGAPSDVTGQITATTTAKSLVDAVDDMFTRATKDDE